MTVYGKAWLGLIFLSVVMGLALLGSAGTIHYLEAWVFLAVFMGASILITSYLSKYDPALLQRRVSAGPVAEKEATQKLIQLLTSLVFLALLIVPGLDHRFGWSAVPVALVLFGDLLVAAGFYIVFLVYKENTFTSATIEVTEGQRVIGTGPYAIVRHPMYVGGLSLLLGMPLALGSWWGLVVFVPMIPAILWRLLDEERFLTKNLPGYAEYKKKVRSRLIPRVF